MLPGVYLAAPDRPSRRQAQVAALLYAGPESALDDVDACAHFGLKAAALVEGHVFVVVPDHAKARGAGYVHVRRTSRPFVTLYAGPLRYVDPATALIAVARRLRSEQAVLAVLSEGVQRRVVRLGQLVRAHDEGPPKGARLTHLALSDLGAGVRSAPEGAFRRLALRSRVLPPLLYNRRLRLPTGRIVVPDALALDAGLVHETNGRGPHEREDLFESMQVRHDAMTEADVIVLHNSPRRIRRDGPAVIAQFERCYLANTGRGLPEGVELLPEDL
jgi:hypothetical protein